MIQTFLAQSVSSGSSFNLRGAWIANTAYAIGDVVTYQGSSYVTKAAFTSGPTFDATKWTLLAQAGAQGATGVGVKGDTGATGGTGPAGPSGLKGDGFLFRGDWTASTAYAAGDVVRYAGQTYLTPVAYTSGSAFDASKVTLWAAKGDYGVLFYLRDYGGKEDGGTNDTAAWRKLIAAVTAKGRGAIICTGMSICDPGVIKLPSFSAVRGCGHHTGIQWSDVLDGSGNSQHYSTSGDWLVDISGASSGDYLKKVTLSDLCLSGGSGGTAPLLRMFYAGHCITRNLYGVSASYGFLHAAQLWDTRITDTQLEYCGTGENTVAMLFENSAAPNGSFGNSGDTGNQNYVTNTRIEDCFGCGIRVVRGTDNGSPPNGYWFTNTKIETNNAISAPQVHFAPGVTNCHVDRLYMSVNGRFGSGTALIDGLLNEGAGGNSFSCLSYTANADGLTGAPIRHRATGPDHYQDLTYTGSGGTVMPAANCVLSIESNSMPPRVSGVVYSFPQIASIKGVGGAIRTGSNAIVTPYDRYIKADASGGSFNLQLPSAAFMAGELLTITKVDYSGNTVTLTPYATASASEVMSDNTSLVMSKWHSTVMLLADPDATQQASGASIRGWTVVSAMGVPVGNGLASG